MNKLAAAVIAVLAILLLGSPFATGMMAEAGLVQRIGALDANALFDAEITHYERGYRTSRGRIELGLSPEYLARLRGAAAPGELPPGLGVERLPVIVDIEHGPVSFADGVHLGMARVVARPDPEAPQVQMLEQWLAMPYLFEFRGRAGFGNRFEFDAHVPPIDYSGPDAEIDFTGFALTGAVTGNVLVAEGAADELRYRNPLASAMLESVAVETEYQYRADRLPLGRARLRVGRALASSPLLGGQPLFELDGLAVVSDAALDASGERIDASVVYTMDSVAAGRSFAVTAATVGIALTGIDAEAAARYYALAQQAGAGAIADPDAFVAELTPIADRIARRGLGVSAEPIRFSTPDGDLDGRIRVDIDASGLPPDQPADLRDIAVLFGAVSADAAIDVSKPLAERLAALAIRAQLETSMASEPDPPSPDELAAMAEAQAGFVLLSLTGQGILVDDGDSYSTSLDFTDGAVTVNGAPLPFGLP